MEKYSIEPYKEEGSTTRDYRSEDAYIRAKKRVDQLVGFYWHFAVYVVVNLFLILLIGYYSDSFWNFGTFATAIFWGIGLVFHFLGVFGPNFMFGKDWEKRKIKEYMERERKTWE
ncbi:MAG: 2TM domain-containing protein [Bacteroidota bacterium]